MTKKYLGKKLIELIFTIFFVTLLSFLLMRMGSINPAEAYAKRSIGNPSYEQIEAIKLDLGFDKSILVQYGRWLKGLIYFDFGTSLKSGRSVGDEIKTALPKTITIVSLSAVMQAAAICFISVAFFLINSQILKRMIRILCIVAISIPSFYIAMLYLDFFGVQNNMVSVTGNTSWLSMISPAVCLAVFCTAFYIPMLLDALEKESREDYAFFMRSQGLSETHVVLKHILPQAVLGLVPSFMLNIGLCMIDSMIIEQVFSVPGFGNLIVNAVLDRDSPMIHAAIFFLALILALCYLISDLITWQINKAGEAV